MTSKPLDAETRRALRGRGHALHPIVTIGERGLAESVLAELEVALEAHELVKVRLPAIDRTERTAIAEQMEAETGAVRVQIIGRVVLLYRERTKQPEESKPAPARARKPVKRTRLR